MSDGLLDPLGRTSITAGMKAQIAAAFADLPDDKRGAILLVGDEHGATAHLAAKIGDRWKVAAGAGFIWTDLRHSTANVVVEYAW